MHYRPPQSNFRGGHVPRVPRGIYAYAGNAEGEEICRLLKRAFNAGLVFTIGSSTTSGRDNVVTWNDIHHKTKPHGP